MAIKPIDFQVMIPRTMEAAKVSNDETHRHHSMLQQQASATKHKAEESLKTVYARTQAQDARIQEKQKGNGQNSGKKKKENQNSEESDDSGKNRLNKGFKTSTIDIKI